MEPEPVVADTPAAEPVPAEMPAEVLAATTPKKRGRPVGSNNKLKVIGQAPPPKVLKKRVQIEEAESEKSEGGIYSSKAEAQTKTRRRAGSAYASSSSSNITSSPTRSSRKGAATQADVDDDANCLICDNSDDAAKLRDDGQKEAADECTVPLAEAITKATRLEVTTLAMPLNHEMGR